MDDLVSQHVVVETFEKGESVADLSHQDLWEEGLAAREALPDPQ